MITNFHNKRNAQKCLSIVMLDSVIKANETYYPQTLLEECKYVQEKIKNENHIDEDLERSEADNDSNNETESDINNLFLLIYFILFFSPNKTLKNKINKKICIMLQ